MYLRVPLHIGLVVVYNIHFLFLHHDIQKPMSGAVGHSNTNAVLMCDQPRNFFIFLFFIFWLKSKGSKWGFFQEKGSL